MVEWSTVTIDKFTAMTSKNKWQRISASNTSWTRKAASEIRSYLTATIIPLFSKHRFRINSAKLRNILLHIFRISTFLFVRSNTNEWQETSKCQEVSSELCFWRKKTKSCVVFVVSFLMFLFFKAQPSSKTSLYRWNVNYCHAKFAHVSKERYTFHSVPFPNTHQLVYHRSWVEPRVCE